MSEAWDRYQAIVESAVDFAIVGTDQEGLVTHWNSGAERLLGWSAAEMLGAPVDRFFTPEDRAAGWLATEMRLALAHGRAADERWHLRRDGARFWASGEMMPLRDETGGHLGFVKVIRDRTAQHEAEVRLREGEARYRTLFEAIDAGFCLVEVDLDGAGGRIDYRVVEANPAFYRNTGFPPDILGRWLREAAPALEEHWFETYGRVARTGEALRFEQGSEHLGRWFDVHAFRVSGPAEGRVAILFNDISARRRAELALQEGEARFRNMADHAPVMMWVTDPSGHCTYLNRAWYEFTGQTPEAAQGFGWLEATHPDDKAASERVFLAANAGREPFRLEYRLRRHDGSYRWAIDAASPRFGAQGEFLGYIGSVIDIDERREAEDALRRTEERLRLATQAAEVGFWDVDLVGDALIWPPSVRAMFGISPGVAVSLTDFYEGLHPEDREATSAAFAAACDPGLRALYDVEYRTVGREDGVVRWVAAKGRGVFDGGGRCVRVLGTAIDVTARKAVEAELRELNERLEGRVAEEVAERAKAEDALRQSQKMEAVGQLTGGLAHDFNNLLAGISGSLEMMSSRIAQGRLGDVERYVLAAQGAAKRAAALTHRLLAFSRRQTLDPRPTDVNALVRGMEDLIRRTVGPSIAVEAVGSSGLWPALVDAGQLENALLNLCINARDAMPEGGRITIETANRWLDGRMACEHDMEPGQYLSLCVTDTGTGMTPEVAGRAFDPFFTTKPLGEGTGLGLSMVYGFARQSGGQARIYSEPGQGTTVCVYLPRHRGAAEGAAAQAGPGAGAGPEAPPKDTRTVLVVDDEPTVRMLLVDILADLGLAAIEAGDGAAGLEVLRSEAPIDLLVTDVGLPGGLNGRQLADAARASRPDLPVLLVTGYAENAVLGQGSLAPGMQVVTKPFGVEALSARIRAMIGDG